ncbi:AraC family transcriptional regulator [Paenibacillus sp. JCM 10914]|uniref:helix-turn-helix domain-containing protein n=1 Tax=Paenibacillus sp. JCM 10914 TaxID=1236974 RepID=UPI0003CC575B|nr:AraC family transcriptional regulator [Paenibacillus sp. JCM 10914]GAE07877.1 transcriptional regulator, AraC family [Paenibacillus sp. JCM 10914]
MDYTLREPMTMPDPQFPIKVHRCDYAGRGQVLFNHHWHEHLEFLYFVSGEATLECGSSTFNVKAGDLIVVNRNELHYGISLSEHLFYYALIADFSLLQSHSLDAPEMKFITPITQNRMLFANQINGDDARASMLAIVKELEAREFGYELAIKSELYRLLTLLLRGYVATVLTQDEYVERMKNVERFAPIFKYIEEHYREELSVELLSGMAGLSRYHFSRLFKEISGRTVTEYVNETRLNRADFLLRSSPLTVSEIATATGFKDIYYFSRTFKKYKQMAPSALRKK